MKISYRSRHPDMICFISNIVIAGVYMEMEKALTFFP